MAVETEPIPFAKEPEYQFVSAWGSKGSEIGQFDDPTGLALSGSELFVSDARNGRMRVQNNIQTGTRTVMNYILSLRSINLPTIRCMSADYRLSTVEPL